MIEKTLNVYLSNRLEILYQQLKQSLFKNSTKPLQRRLVIVHGPAIKNWLVFRMAQDRDLNVAMGIEFLFAGQAFEYLLELSTGKNGGHFPSVLELSFAIEAELQSIVQKYTSLDQEEQRDWDPILHHLKLDRHSLSPTLSLSRKMERRVIGLSEHLGRLFHDYGRYSLEMVAQWEKLDFPGWQPRLWRKLFVEKKGWNYPVQALRQEIDSKEFLLSIFSVSFMPRAEFAFLDRLSRKAKVDYYLLSPCAVFWSDIRSDREGTYLENYWHKKLGKDSSQTLKLEELLRDRNPLLANFGRLGREMACQIEESRARMHALYTIPAHVKELHQDLEFQEDLILTETPSPLSLLHALQADLLLMRNPQDAPPFNVQHVDPSIQLHVAPCRRREVEILYHNILRLMLDDSTLCPGEVVVMAPHIEEYAPFIRSIFGGEQSQLDYQILDLGIRRQNEVLQGFMLLLELSDGRWDASELLQLFGHSAFQRCHQLSPNDCIAIQEWIEESNIRWGNDWMHRDQLLQKRHCLSGSSEQTMVGTWDYGLSRLMLGLVSSQESLFDIPLKPSINFSEGELLGKWARILLALRDDLSPLQDSSRMTISDWVNYLNCLLDNYFIADHENQKSISDYEELKELFEILRISGSFIQEERLTFASIKTRLLSLFDNRETMYREERLQAVRFCSLMPLRSVPAKAIALLGMQEDAFPRINIRSSLNQMQGHEKGDFSPSPTDFDRYLFLEALHAAQDCLLLSYCGFNQEDNKELNPSLLVEELFSYLDQFYTILGKKISEINRFRHPFDAFDPRYFTEGTLLNNFSMRDFQAATALCQSDKLPPHRFVQELECVHTLLQDFIPSKSFLNLKQLISVAKDPIRFHFNKTLEMYLESPEERRIKIDEELSMTQLDRYYLKQETTKEPIEKVLLQAEREGKLPFGIFKEVAKKYLKNESDELHQALKNHSLTPSDIFEIEFAADCSSPCQLDQERWLFPPVVLTYAEGYQFSIIGKLPLATAKGLLTLNKDSFSEIWKTWPQFLLYCCAAKLCPHLLKPQLIPARSAKAKKAFFDDPEPYLKQFIHYYALCVQNFSPLTPDWIPLFLKGDAKELQDKIGAYMADTSRSYKSPYLQYIFNQHQRFDTQNLLDTWKEQAELLAADIIKFWFQRKLQEAVK